MPPTTRCTRLAALFAFLMLASTATAGTCVGDIDGDGDVGFSDLLSVISAWGPCDGACPADLDGDLEVGFGDLLTVLAAWG
ncbi:MAG: hypothetical protein KJO43_01340, partial [Phycisphaerae bacterium]|nr:hypothetical protein [Phycisphaerae bacterium]